jgi:hypothetical protein
LQSILVKADLLRDAVGQDRAENRRVLSQPRFLGELLEGGKTPSSGDHLEAVALAFALSLRRYDDEILQEAAGGDAGGAFRDAFVGMVRRTFRGDTTSRLSGICST